MNQESAEKHTPANAPIPRHVAIIMDGNGRWASKRFLPRVAGHVKGVDAVRTIIEACSRKGIPYLTLFAFSSENWRRPADEVSALMKLFASLLEKELNRIHTNQIRLKIVGDISRFDPYLQDLIRNAELKTEANRGLTLTICANYGGRWDIVQALNTIKAQIGPDAEVTEDLLSSHLAMAYAPEPDLFIRTGGEQRISNFLLWQLAYCELYFTDTFWPDFNAESLNQAIFSYQSRERRFGRTSAQLIEHPNS